MGGAIVAMLIGFKPTLILSEFIKHSLFVPNFVRAYSTRRSGGKSKNPNAA
jgi:hypothetical protein